MTIGNAAFERGEQLAEQERETGIAAARQTLHQSGSAICISCGAEIEPDRREALPSARRCLECQELNERHAARKVMR